MRTARPHRTRRTVLAGALSLCLAERARAQAYITTIPPQVANPPPLDPAGESVVPDNRAFHEECLSLIPALRKNILLGRSMMTETAQWGLVLRIDFSMVLAQAHTADTVNRLVFWRGPGGTPFILVAVAQNLPPLP